MSALLLHPNDTILVVTTALAVGDTVAIDGAPIRMAVPIEVGHKIARHALATGDTVIKYGAPIGSMTAPAVRGDHVHLHNMKSDYIAMHLRDTLERSTS
ncbi:MULTISPECIES: UxaA family hydrolase [unclassified Sphingomonas]|uniref:UxaA family hydrolase n=1 Tax=unclassified Sphingomonas TaxID=196159 RepID=UPI000287C96D|nr:MULTISPECIES: UxaA family hydrolase [unclassified Sphingomonas]